MTSGAARARGWLVAGLLLAAGTPAAQQPTFRSSVELVEVAVLVKDKEGRFVPNLRQSDFEVFEQGVRQQVVAFEPVSLPVASQAALPAGVERVASDVSTNEHASDARVFVLLLDGLHVDSRRTHEVRRLAREFVSRHVGVDDLVAVVSPGALAQATQDFTRDKARVLAAIDRFTGTKLISATAGIEEERRAEERGGVKMHEGFDPNDAERVLRVRALTEVLEALGRHMARVQRRRKALLLFSEGIDYNLGDVMGDQTRYANDVQRANLRAVRSLMRANVSVYAVDPRRLGSAEGELGEQSYALPRGASLGPSVDQEYTDSITSLRRVSEETGGFATLDRNSYAGAFERIIDESSRYYVLGYEPEKAMKPGEYREISVRVSLPGVSVVARKGHTAPQAPAARAAARADEPANVNVALPFSGPQGRARPGMPAELPAPTAGPRRATTNDLQALLATPLPLGGLPMRVQAIPFTAGAGKKGSVQLVVELLGAGLQFAQNGGRFEERIELALMTVDAGAKADNGHATTLELRLTREELERVRATGVRWLSRLDVAPGRYQVRVAARSARSGATGLVTADVEVEKPAPERVSLSGITLTSMTSVLMVTRGDAKPSALATPPSAARTFVAGDTLTVGALVSVPAGVPDLELSARVEWPDGSRNPPIRKKVAGAAQARSEEVAIPIETALLPPDVYVLRVALASPAGADKTERLIPFEITAAAAR